MTNSTTTQIKKGMVVLYEGGWYRVTYATKNKVNLGSVFGNHIYHKSVDINLVVEDEAAWYAAWQKSDSYQCM